MSKIRLGVNIDHVATVRNARGDNYPSPLRAALMAQKYELRIRGCIDPTPFLQIGIDASIIPLPRTQDILVIDNVQSLSQIPQWSGS